ncbi:MAG: methylated-DNA--[protein]-cysteine S-methyltransferase [bacterium]|nr:MAG: methylated-DNA--[protein]-cysteine S-methyltransferase [bacterium]
MVPRRVFFDLEDAIRDCPGSGPLAGSLERYLAGEPEPLDFPVDLDRLPSFTRMVLEYVKEIPYGTVATYGCIAAGLGRRGASRAVGRAMGANPLPLVIPCHRVIAAGGGPGGFTSGIQLKLWLLALEGVRI